MAAYRDEDIEELITCLKKVLEPPKKEMKLAGAYRRNDMKLVATDSIAGEFQVFMRRSDEFPENFSIGLIYQPNNERGEIVLMRCNGQHGLYNGMIGDRDHPHWDYHIHRATAKALEAGEKAEKFAAKTAAYASFEDALQYFVIAGNLDQKDAGKYFPGKTQTLLLF